MFYPFQHTHSGHNHDRCPPDRLDCILLIRPGSMPKWLGLCSREERPPPFEYGTLQPNHIRILVLLPGTPSDPVQCSFSVVPRDEAPSIWFEALSYCWGPEPRVFEFITIDGKTKAVWPNLYGALLALRRENEARSLWIDAVCIDQASVAEKDDQVPSMALIYRAAACVVVWLGGSYEDSDYAMDTIRCGRRGAYTEERFIMAMLNLAGRPWFTRTWIVQEFVLNRASPQMVCGSQEPVGCEEFFGAFDVAVMELSRCMCITFSHAQECARSRLTYESLSLRFQVGFQRQRCNCVPNTRRETDEEIDSCHHARKHTRISHCKLRCRYQIFTPISARNRQALSRN